MNKRKLVDIIKNPPIWLLILIYVLTAIFIGGALVFTLIEAHGIWLQILAYVFYALAAMSLGYTVYTVIVIAPKVKKSCKKLINRYDFTREIAQNYGARTVVFTTVSFLISIAYGAYNFTLSALERSVWYGILASYYILLACMRGGVITHHRKKHNKQKRGEMVQNEYVKQIKRYRNCGIMLIIMTFALSIAVLQMVLIHRTFTHNGLMIYVSAVYTVYKVTMSIINIVKAKRQNDMTVQALRNINLADAFVSILALQTSMLTAFSQGNEEFSPEVLNAITGGIVCIIVFALGIYMTIKAHKILRFSTCNNALNTNEENCECENNEKVENNIDDEKGVGRISQNNDDERG